MKTEIQITQMKSKGDKKSSCHLYIKVNGQVTFWCAISQKQFDSIANGKANILRNDVEQFSLTV